jgi:hypothetical protein
MIDYLIDVSAVVIGIFLYKRMKDWWEIRKWRNHGKSYYGDIDDG